MNNFISYNEYKNVLNETYESYQEIKLLAKDIFDAFDKTVKIVGTQAKYYTQGKKNQVYLIKRLVKRKFKVIDEFVNSSVGIIVYGKNDKVFRGSYVQPEFYSEIEDANNTTKQLQQIYVNGIVVIYKHDVNVLIHELTHAYDDFRAKGKLLNTKKGYEFGKKVEIFNSMQSSKDRDLYLQGPFIRTYYRTPHELSAFFTKTLSMIEFFSDEKETQLKDFKDVYDEFKDVFQGYEYLTPKDKKMLVRKLSQYYHKMKERNITEE